MSPATPTTPGMGTLLSVVHELIRRPPFAARPTEPTSRGEHSLPLLCLVGEAASAQAAPWLRDRLGAGPAPRVPHAWVDAETAAARSRERWQDEHRSPPLLPLLDEIHTALRADRFGPQPQLSFDLYGLADWLTGQELGPSQGRQDRRMADLLRQWAGRPDQPEKPPAAGLSEAVADAPSGVVRGALHLLLEAGRRVGLRRLAQRTPGLGREARWFMRRQTYMVPRHSASFRGFAERLTPGARESENPDHLKKLLVHAFLEDLRSAYRRRRRGVLPRRAGWRKTAYVTVLLDRPSEANGGWELLRLVNEVRNETGAHDPLLVIATAERPPGSPSSGPDGAGGSDGTGGLPGPERAAAELSRWRRQLPGKRQRLGENARYLWIGLPGRGPSGDGQQGSAGTAGYAEPGAEPGAGREAGPGAGRETAADSWDAAGRLGSGTSDGTSGGAAGVPPDEVPPPSEGFQPRPPPWPARRGVGETLLALVLILTLLPLTHRVADSWAADCSHFRNSWEDGIAVQVAEFGPGDRQCIGYSDSPHQIFGSNERLRQAQRTVFAENAEAERLHDRQPERPFVSVVHFAGLTHQDAERDTDHAAAEELEGLAVRQGEQNDPTSSQPLLRVVVANAGDGMSKAPDVVRDMLRPLAQNDPSVVAVLGLDRTVPASREAITQLGLAGVPVLGTTLTGTDLDLASPLYFQLVPDNARQAQLIADYAAYRGADPVTVYHPPLDESDAYVSTLVEEASERLAEDGRTVSSVAWQQSPGDLSSLCVTNKERTDELVYYVGREEAFGDFLRQVTDGCTSHRQLPVIVGADAVSRFVAQQDRRAANALAGLSVSYVGMGSLVTLAGASCAQDGVPDPALGAGTPLDAFCAGYAQLHAELDELPEHERPAVAWPAERTGIAYDASGMIVAAVAELHQRLSTREAAEASDPAPAPHRAALAQQLREKPFQGASGEIDFRSSRIGNDRSLAVLELSNIHDIDEEPSCVYLTGRLFDSELPPHPDTGCPT